MKKWIWGLLILLATIASAIAIYIYSSSEKRPEGNDGPIANEIAHNIYNAVNKEAWDSLAYVGWTFGSSHTYLWDKQNNVVEVNWESYKVLLDPVAVEGLAYLNEQEVKGVQADELVNDAFSMYCNDGFWFHAFTKLHDPGAKLEWVEKGNEKALLVTYESGGVTPGDAYLWYTDSNGLPRKFEVWASILPLKGMDFTWENWDTLYNGAMVAKDHQSDVVNVKIDNIISGPDLSSIGRDEGLFDALLKEE